MGLEEAKAVFDKLAHAVQDALPEEKEASVHGMPQPEVLGLVPEPLRQEALASTSGLSDDEVFFCINRLTERSGVRPALGAAVCSFFAAAVLDPAWRELFARANKSPAAAAKRAGAPA